MDKETLIRIAQPAATFALAISIISLPLIVKASDYMSIRGTYTGAPLRGLSRKFMQLKVSYF